METGILFANIEKEVLESLLHQRVQINFNFDEKLIFSGYFRSFDAMFNVELTEVVNLYTGNSFGSGKFNGQNILYIRKDPLEYDHFFIRMDKK
ncbi:hypothetical protein TNIN_73221 [Trichonephila inaurata madagascariensis]|uniref:Sm domain-containing protein n=1 Tax=Trichonephila inaurata madagascariensis TaxID=2747483 RepID=A0A8X6YRI3_9ARAC|nr:hypothetical protein TNIN_73221 [Trichonephila inaurata madagascariensis]